VTKAAQRFDHLEASAQGDYSVAPFGAIRAGKRYGSPQVPAAISKRRSAMILLSSDLRGVHRVRQRKRSVAPHDACYLSWILQQGSLQKVAPVGSAAPPRHSGCDRRHGPGCKIIRNAAPRHPR
jgi:hypothetical protein